MPTSIRRVVRLTQTSVGKKVLMAVSGLILVAFVVAHMVGNLKVFTGPESFDAYAEFLRALGYPLLPHSGFLWVQRVGLLLVTGVHVWTATVLARESRAARPQPYRKSEWIGFAYASRTMRWGGVILVAFVVYHLLHLTVGSLHPDFVAGGAYHNLVVGFQNPAVVLAYAAAVSALSLHLYHGIWSVFQTLGFSHPHYAWLRRPLAATVSLGLLIGFLVVPISVQLGILALP